MTPLNEVIKALSICKNPDINRTCKDCPMPDTQECMGVLMTDALHYLKMYRSDQIQWEADREDWRDKWETYIEAREMHLDAVKELKRNDLLTWQELQQMEGKTVWVVVDGKERWRIIREVTKEHLILESGLPLHKSWMNHLDGWQAYRKERE